MLLATIYLIGGLLVQKSEILIFRYFNIVAGGLQNIFIQKGYIVIQIVGDKTFQYQGERKVQQVLPQYLSYIVVTFIVVIIPFLETIELQQTEGNSKCLFLFSYQFYRLEPDLISARDIIEAVKATLLRGLPNTIIVAVQYYIAIAFNRRYLTSKLVDRLTTIADKDDDNTIDLIAGYIIYSIEIYYIYEIDKGSKLDEFLALGFKQHCLQRLISAKRELDDSDAEDRRLAQDYQQQERLEGLEYLLTNDKFQQIYQISDVQLQDYQQRIFETIAIGVDKFLYIARTRVGKLVVFALLAYTILFTIIVVV